MTASGQGWAERWLPRRWALWVAVPFLIVAVVSARRLVSGGGAALWSILTQQQAVLLRTAVYAAATATTATVLGWALAHSFRLLAFPGRRLVHRLVLAALLMPSFTFAMALVILVGHGGYVSQVLGGPPLEIYGLVGLVTGGSLARLPYAYLILLVAYRSVDRTHLEAADLVGASGWQTMRAVVWPRLRGTLVVAWLMVFADAAADLANPLVIGGDYRVVASRLYEAVIAESDLSSAVAYGVLLVLPASGAWLATSRLHRWRSSPSPATVAVKRRPTGWQWLLPGLAWFVAGTIALLMATVCFASLWLSPGVGLHAYRAVLSGPSTRAVATTVLLALICVPAALLAGVTLGVRAATSPDQLAWAQRFWSSLVAIPSLVLGLGGLLVWFSIRELGGGPWPVLGPLAMIGMVLILRMVPAVAVSTLGAVRPFVPHARDTATLLGARGLDLVRSFYLPRLRHTIREATVMTAARALTATSSVILLADVEVPILTARMLVEVDAGRLATASAMAVTLGALVAAAGLFVWGWADDRSR